MLKSRLKLLWHLLVDREMRRTWFEYLKEDRQVYREVLQKYRNPGLARSSYLKERYQSQYLLNRYGPFPKWLKPNPTFRTFDPKRDLLSQASTSGLLQTQSRRFWASKSSTLTTPVVPLASSTQIIQESRSSTLVTP